MHPQIQYTGGKTWLLLQALTGYEIFTGQKPDLEKMAARL
jgi:shikimate 5-dehydrogenase